MQQQTGQVDVTNSSLLCDSFWIQSWKDNLIWSTFAIIIIIAVIIIIILHAYYSWHNATVILCMK